ncbi:MAG: fluoride efflux transporter CrcB [Bacillota bacterium]
MLYIFVAITGFLGALARVLTGKIVNSVFPSVFPLGTFAVNLSGSFLMCLFMTVTMELLKIRAEYRTAVATGFLGAYTTFSIFSLETFNLFYNGQALVGVLYFLGTPLGCIAAGWLGYLGGEYIVKEHARQIKRGQNSQF